MLQPLLIPIGGFLGAGKTTLLARAARELSSRAVPVAAITNDQAENLVDTAQLRAQGLTVAEVAGGCFCCRFDDLQHAAASLEREIMPRAILAEPVGSCTDLAATVVRPWRRLLGRDSAPLSVLIDPARLDQALNHPSRGPLAPEAAYIVHQQLQEADAIVLTKIDTLDGERYGRAIDAIRQAFPERPVFGVSAATGEGVGAWLDFILSPDARATSGELRIDVDYDIYARGEAALGWLNAHGHAKVGRAGGASLAAAAVERLQHACHKAGAPIAHVKLRVESHSAAAQAHATSCDTPVFVHGSCPQGAAHATLNARVQLAPAALMEMVNGVIGEAGDISLSTVACFAPGRPVPRHRA